MLAEERDEDKEVKKMEEQRTGRVKIAVTEHLSCGAAGHLARFAEVDFGVKWPWIAK